MTTFVFTQALDAINSKKNSLISKFNSSPIGQLVNYAKDQTTWKKDKISGKLSEISLQTSTYNKIIPIVYGTNKLAGNIIWLGEVREVRNDNTTTLRIGKGQKIKQTSIDYFYFLSFAIAICKGEISELKNVWADTTLLDMNRYLHRFYPGTSTQMPDSLIEALGGVGKVSAYRDICYIVFENFPLSEFNNRIPNFLFEVTRKNEIDADDPNSLENCIKGINLAPSSGEYTFSTALQYKAGEQFAPDVIDTVDGIWYKLNGNNNSKIADGLLSLNQAIKEFKNCVWFAPQIAFFGDNLDIANCSVRPRVTFNYFQTGYPIFTKPDRYTVGSKWHRYNTPMLGTNPDGIFRFLGGTGSDSSILDFFKTLKNNNKRTVFHPKLLMDISGTPSSKLLKGDSSAIEAFFNKTDGYNEFIIHYANLLRGYVDVFLIGSELIGLTSIKDNTNNFPAVNELIELASQVRNILGSGVKISYAASYSEYHNIEQWYALDKLWSSNFIDFVGVNAYFPLTNLSQDDITKDIVKNGWKSGEGYDYVTVDGKQINIESKYAYKNIEYWWNNSHINPDGTATGWKPRMKKIWFTEYGFCSVDGATNEPYKNAGDFPKYSLGSSDFFAQRIAIEATEELFKNSEYVENRIVCYWDARPYPFYPNRTDIWVDGALWKYDYSLNGKIGISNANILIYQLFRDANIDTELIENIEVDEFVDGFVVNNSISVRDALYILQKVYFFDCIENNGKISFISNKKSNRNNKAITEVYDDELISEDKSGTKKFITTTNLSNNDLPKKLNLIFLDKNNDYDTTSVYSERNCIDSNKSDIETIPVVLDSEKARNIAEISLYSSWIERTTFNFVLPIKYLYLNGSDLIKLYANKNELILKIKNVELENNLVKVEATQFDSTIYKYIDNKPLNPNLEIISEVGETYLKILEIPAINQEMLNKICVFLVINGEFLNWNGANVYFSDDYSKTYKTIEEARNNSLLGHVINKPENARPYYFDIKNKLKISFHGGVDTEKFKNITDLELYNGENKALYGNEIIQFKNIALENDGSYSVSGLLRGLYGTENEIENHKTGDIFIILDTDIITQEFSYDKINFSYFYKAVSFENDIIDAKAQLYTLSAKNLKPLPPCHLKVKCIDKKIFIKWEERGRGYTNWIDNTDYISIENNGKFNVEIITDDKIIDSFSTTDKYLEYIVDDIVPIKIRVCQENKLFGKGEWSKINV